MIGNDRYAALVARMRAGEQIVIDGGTGTEVERRGVPQLDNAWNGGGTLTHPEIVRAIHQDYLRHGAEIIISNTFSTTRHALRDAGVEDQFEIYNRRGVALALEARNAMEHGGAEEWTAENTETRQGLKRSGTVLVAGGISYWSWTGKHPPLDDLRAGAIEQAAIMANAGADLLMLEMMVDVERMLVTLEAAQSAGLPVWVGVSCRPNADGVMCLWDGDTLADALRALTGRGVDLVSIMHTDLPFVDECLEIAARYWDGLIGAYPHCEKRLPSGIRTFENTISPEDFAGHAKRWLGRNIHMIGGCCGIRPDHMEKVSALV